MFGINKNGLKQKIGVLMPSFFPASRTSYDNTGSGLTSTNAQDARDELISLDYFKVVNGELCQVYDDGQ